MRNVCTAVIEQDALILQKTEIAGPGGLHASLERSEGQVVANWSVPSGQRWTQLVDPDESALRDPVVCWRRAADALRGARFGPLPAGSGEALLDLLARETSTLILATSICTAESLDHDVVQEPLSRSAKHGWRADRLSAFFGIREKEAWVGDEMRRFGAESDLYAEIEAESFFEEPPTDHAGGKLGSALATRGRGIAAISDDGASFRVVLTRGDGSRELLALAGFGAGRAVDVVASLLSYITTPLALDHPDAHLDRRTRMALAALLIRVLPDARAPVLVETVSEEFAEMLLDASRHSGRGPGISVLRCHRAASGHTVDAETYGPTARPVVATGG